MMSIGKNALWVDFCCSISAFFGFKILLRKVFSASSSSALGAPPLSCANYDPERGDVTLQSLLPRFVRKINDSFHLLRIIRAIAFSQEHRIMGNRTKTNPLLQQLVRKEFDYRPLHFFQNTMSASIASMDRLNEETYIFLRIMMLGLFYASFYENIRYPM